MVFESRNKNSLFSLFLALEKKCGVIGLTGVILTDGDTTISTALREVDI